MSFAASSVGFFPLEIKKRGGRGKKFKKGKNSPSTLFFL